MNLISKFPALEVRDYRLYWSSQWVALIGFWMQLTAQQWLVYEITNSAFLLGVLGAVQFLPSFIFSLFIGFWIDRHDKKKILTVTQCMYIIQSVCLGILILSGHANYYWILFFAFVVGTIDSIDMPTRLSFLPDIVGKDALHSAISLNSTNFNLTRMIGPLLAAFLINFFPYDIIFFLNALSIIPVLIAYKKMKAQSSISTSITKNATQEIKKGITHAKSKPIILCNLIALAIVSGLILNFGSYGPLLADRVLHAGVNGFGFILFGFGTGSMIGGLISAAAKTQLSQKWVFINAILCGLELSAVSYISNFFISIIIFIFMGFSVTLFLVNCNTAIQIASNKNYLGRIMSLYTFVYLGSAPFGSLFVSSMLESFGTSLGLFLTGLIDAVFITFLVFFYKKQISNGINIKCK